jgi:hypothetical protein
LLPGLPFAPGHKGMILLPLYVVAGLLMPPLGLARYLTESWVIGHGNFAAQFSRNGFIFSSQLS